MNATQRLKMAQVICCSGTDSPSRNGVDVEVLGGSPYPCPLSQRQPSMLGVWGPGTPLWSLGLQTVEY